jgi:hypothetical protein
MTKKTKHAPNPEVFLTVVPVKIRDENGRVQYRASVSDMGDKWQTAKERIVQLEADLRAANAIIAAHEASTKLLLQITGGQKQLKPSAVDDSHAISGAVQ